MEHNWLRLESDLGGIYRAESCSESPGGDVILLHDGGHASFGADRSATVGAVDRLLTRYQSQYEFVTIPVMMQPESP